ncbi:MAG TPA: hypothetical protein VJ953_04360 [Saprospiraceae bacterium]|nr:hypothetical protein [Saprospiraceae bacterium]
MKALNVEELQFIEGGVVDCGEGWGITAALVVGGIVAATVFTGGWALAGVVVAAEAGIVGSPIAGINCLVN